MQSNKIIFGLCIFAALRVFVYSSALPLFNNVDEICHFDLVVKYCKANYPTQLETYSGLSTKYMAKCGSTEYAVDPKKNKTNAIPYFLSGINDSTSKALLKGLADYWSVQTNYESGTAPLYYFIAGAWAKLGIVLGLFDSDTCYLPYWVRYLNILFIILLILITSKIAKLLFPQNKFLLIGMPLLAAVMPQDTFYSVQSDVLSPIFYGFTCFYVIKLIQNKDVVLKHYLLTGICISCVVLIKIINFPLALIVFYLVVNNFIKQHKKQPKAVNGLMTFLIAAILPIALWGFRNTFYFGDFFATETKIKLLSWKHKEISEWLNTPFLTFNNQFQFITEILESFWRGEIIWYGKAISESHIDTFYWSSSIIMIFASMFTFKNSFQWQKNQLYKAAALSFFSLLLFNYVLSFAFEFPPFNYPSSEKPFFVSGRLLSAALIPFIALYLIGLNTLMTHLKNEKIKLSVLCLLALIITATELSIHYQIFESKYNFFHIIFL